MNALAFDRMTLVDSAPAPLIAMPVVPTDTAIDAATETAVIVALSVALRLIPPLVEVVVKFPALMIDASMLLAI